MLVLSEFVGCSPSVSGALRVNPWSTDSVADGISAFQPHSCHMINSACMWPAGRGRGGEKLVAGAERVRGLLAERERRAVRQPLVNRQRRGWHISLTDM